MSTENRFTLVEAGVFEAWIQLHPSVLRTRKNAKAFGDYLEARGQRITMKTLDEAFVALRAEAALEIAKTAQEVEQEQIEKVRQAIYAEVNQKLSPARIDFTNTVVLNKIATWLHKFEKGYMSTDRVLRAIEAHKFDEGFWLVPPADLYKSQEYVHGRRNYAKDAKPPEETEHGPFGRRNHALDDVIDKESANRIKKLKKGIDEEEGRRIGMVVEHAISGYRAQKFNRIDNVQTEIIQGLLRKYSAKYGTGVIAAIRDLPDDPNAAEMWLRRRI